MRRDAMRARTHLAIARTEDADDAGGAAAVEAAVDDEVGDAVLGLIFTACHPALSADARTALTLRVVAKLTTDEIARAFLSSEATIAQRIVRAKRVIRTAGPGFATPRGAERAARLPSVLEVVYLIFNEGYAATAGNELVRATLCREAQRLGRLLTGLTRDDAEVFGLVALIELQLSRLAARVGPAGELLTLLKQDRSRWDRIKSGLGALAAPRRSAATDHTPCRPRSLPATRVHRSRPTPTGGASRGSTTGSARSCRRRWWVSTGRLRTGWRSGRKRGCGCWTGSARRFADPRRCRRRAATCCSGSGAWPRRA